MSDREHEHGEGVPERAVSRREFLKLAGVAGAAVGMGAGLGGLVAACGGGPRRPRPARPEERRLPPQPVGTPARRYRPSRRRVMRSRPATLFPITGNMAAFGAAAEWEVDYFNKNVWKDGIRHG